MTTWAPSKRARNERIDAEADALIRDLGDYAYQEARRREHEASSDVIAEDWALVAKAIARKTGTRVGLNLSTQLAMNTFFVLDRDPGVAHKPRPRPEPESERQPKGGRRSHSAAIPHPVHGRGNRFPTIGPARRRDPRLRCLRRDHRCRDRRVAAPHDRLAHSRSRGSRGVRPAESRRPIGAYGEARCNWIEPFPTRPRPEAPL